MEGDSNPNIKKYYDVFKDQKNRGYWTVPSILFGEKQYNVFMRCKIKKFQEKFDKNDSVSAIYLLK